MPRDTLVIMLKEPHPGRVKTRLARGIGKIDACWWFRHQSRRLIKKLNADRRWQLVLAVAPDAEGLASRIWPNDIPRIPQGRGDLGMRMANVMRHFPNRRIMIVGSDIPGIHPSLIAAAFYKLAGTDAVIGPAPDGGFWLIGLKPHTGSLPSKLFKNVGWSTEFAMRDTIASLSGRNIAITTTLQDVDTADDLQKLRLSSKLPAI